MRPTRAVSDALAATAGPITANEFLDSVWKIWGNGKAQRSPKGKIPVGLAISGGVDSMALAFLCSRMQKNNALVPKPRHNEPHFGLWDFIQRLEFHAFIVDHGVRRESQYEAVQVSKVLKDQGIVAGILEMKWSSARIIPQKMPNFETLARTRRFGLIGAACAGLGADSLFLAHHADDQAETVMMRLINGHRTAGLSGIKESGAIPECYGLHGVHESGGLKNTEVEARQESKEMSSLQQDELDSHGRITFLGKRIPCEAGGIKIYRPLLGFSKSRLIATCKVADMPWFEDQTNKDPTLTTRNAIRDLYSRHKLPAALTQPAMLALAQRARDRATHLSSVAEMCLSKSEISNFNTGTGTLEVCFPTLVHFVECGVPETEVAPYAVRVIKRIVSLVSPEENISTERVYAMFDRIYSANLYRRNPGARSLTIKGGHGCLSTGVEDLGSDPDINAVADIKSFTSCGVWFQPLAPDGLSWHLSREPHKSPTKSRYKFNPEATEKDNARSRPEPERGFVAKRVISIDPPQDGVSWSKWHLYDGRFWVRVLNHSGKPVDISSFTSEDWTPFKTELKIREWKQKFRRIMSQVPGQTRFTLPSLMIGSKIVALPTLNIALPGIEKILEWEVRYKKVYLNGMNLKDGLEDYESD